MNVKKDIKHQISIIALNNQTLIKQTLIKVTMLMILRNWLRITQKIQAITMKSIIKCNRTILKDNKIKITIRKTNRGKIERNK
jgi:hypothetical protein